MMFLFWCEIKREVWGFRYCKVRWFVFDFIFDFFVGIYGFILYSWEIGVSVCCFVGKEGEY